jgi:hypothetical protein
MTSTVQTSIRLVGYQARASDGATVVGEIEGVRPKGVRIHKIPGHPGHAGYLPAEAIARIHAPTNTVFLGEGIGPEQVLDAPPPPDESPAGWHKSADWWADLLGHYGLFDSEGRGSEPFLHADQK